MSYNAIVCELENVRPHPNGQFIQLANCCGYQVIVGLDSKNDDIGIYFDSDGQLSVEYANANNLIGYIDDITGERKGGYFGKNRKVKTQKFRGEKSEGYFAPLSSLNFTNYDISTLKLGDKFDKLNNIPICNKYVSEATIREANATNNKKKSKYEKEKYQYLHKLFPEHLDTDHFKTNSHRIEKDSLITITSKLHGSCLIAQSEIAMSNGSSTQINKLKIGDMVLGYKDGKILSTKVLNVFNNGKNTDKWLKIKFSRDGCGLGNSFGNVVCTKEHLIYSFTQDKYIEAQNLLPDEEVGVLLKDKQLNKIQMQALIGKLLGDGSLMQNSTSAKVIFGHKEAHLDYIKWMLEILGDIANPKLDYRISGYGTKMVRVSTRYNKFVKNSFYDWINKKDIPERIVTEIEPLAIAIWYMDDGSLAHSNFQEDRANLAICSVEDSKLPLIKNIFKKFNLSPVIYKSENKHWRLRFNKEDAIKFFTLISDYIPPIMQYKLPIHYRNRYKSIVLASSSVEYFIKKVKIINISNANKNIVSSRWDIETETHNFFANKLLVHNSGRANCVPIPVKLNFFQKILNKLFFNNRLHTQYETIHGTRRVILHNKKTDDYYKDNFRDKVLTSLKTCIDKNYIFYYEIVGYQNNNKPIMNAVDISKTKDKELIKRFPNPMLYKYGCLQGECDFYIYRITTINPDGTMEELPWSRVKYLCKSKGIKHVPEIDSFIYDGNEKTLKEYIEYLTELRDVAEPLDKSHIREGICIRVDSPDGKSKIYKNKLFLFKLLESNLKDSGVEDIEEIEDLKKEIVNG